MLCKYYGYTISAEEIRSSYFGIGGFVSLKSLSDAHKLRFLATAVKSTLIQLNKVDLPCLSGR